MMLSWHKVGQKVTPVDDRPWQATPAALAGGITGDVPEFRCSVAIGLAEMNTRAAYPTVCFRPVYPEVIEQLRRACASQPDRATVDA